VKRKPVFPARCGQWHSGRHWFGRGSRCSWCEICLVVHRLCHFCQPWTNHKCRAVDKKTTSVKHVADQSAMYHGT